jgi:hypothetical protein
LVGDAAWAGGGAHARRDGDDAGRDGGGRYGQGGIAQAARPAQEVDHTDSSCWLLTLLREVGGALGAVFGRPPKRSNRPVRAAPGDRRCPARRGAITVIDKESYISDD